MLNFRRSQKQKRIGRHVMRTFAELQQKFGELCANGIRSCKKEMQEKRTESEPIYWMVHPDCPSNPEP